jgi:hypothetical protein
LGPVVVLILIWYVYLRVQGAKALNVSVWKFQIIRQPENVVRWMKVSGYLVIALSVVYLGLASAPS